MAPIGSLRFHTTSVDYDRKIVDWLASDGSVILTAKATITENDVQWWPDPSKWDSSSKKPQAFRGGLNRLSGQGGIGYVDQWRVDNAMSGPCQRATKKF